MYFLSKKSINLFPTTVLESFKKKDFDQKEQKALPQGQTTNNVFVGSTADLQRMLQDEMIDVTPKE